ncbi:Major facilitator superfamily domain-containing protein 1 [Nymphon striatum]|nr:Major facilitator superfamily domain-containing protein 1 [Nymphon striatum]
MDNPGGSFDDETKDKSMKDFSENQPLKSKAEKPDLSYLHPLCNPEKYGHRLIFLVFMSFLGFGNYFVYDNPAALEENFLTDMNLSVTKYSLLYAVYSYPNMILCFFGGFLIDRVFGLRWGAIIFSGFILVGQIVFATGAYYNIFWLALVGRFIFGLGGECLAVAQNLYGVTWFIGKELNMVLGLQLSFARVGSTANLYSMEPLYKYLSKHTELRGHYLLGTVLYYATFTVVFSTICAIICFRLDKRASKLLGRDSVETGEQVKITDVKTFPTTFWFISILCVTYYVAIFPFISLSSLPYIVSAVVAPIIGIIIDKTGRNLVWVLTSVVITLSAHGLIAFTFLSPFIGMAILGVGYAVLACSLWPLVAYVIPHQSLGTAYGIMQSIQNAGLAFIPTVAGAIIDKKGFLQTELLYIGMLACGFLNLKKTERDALMKKDE